jgi:apolipoprotein N-acyltransferase
VTARRRGAAALAATALSAVLYAIAFPPLGVRAAAFVCLVPFLVALRGVGWRGALLLAFLWAELASALVADALPAAVSTYYLQPAAVGWAFAVFVWAVTGSVYYLLFAALYRGLARAAPAGLPFLAAAAWVVCELLRGRLFTGTSFFVGNPWALLGYSQADWLPLVQIASATGVYGVSFLLAAVNAALAELWLSRRGGGSSARHGALGLGIAASLVVAALGFGRISLGRAPERPGRFVPIAVVQGDVDLGRRWRSEFYGENLEVYLDLTRRSFLQADPEIVFWPESALTFFLESEPAYRLHIARVLEEEGAELVVGGPSTDGADEPRYYNSIFLLDGRGELRGRYDKEHLVPFSEHFPLGGPELVRRRFEPVRVFAHGRPTPPLPTRAGPAGILTCNEAMLPEVARRRVRAGAAYLVNPSNDSWISEPKWAEMMFELVRLRAVEQRRYLVRASTSGPSAVVDPWGRVRARTEPRTAGLVLSLVEPRKELSLYARVGDAFASACAGAVALALARGARSSQTRPSAASSRSPA